MTASAGQQQPLPQQQQQQQVAIAQHQVSSGREITYFNPATGKPMGTTTAGGEFFSVGANQDLLFRTRDEAMQYASRQGQTGQLVGESDIPSSQYWQQKTAREEAAKAGYGGIRTPQALSPVGQPVPGSQLAIKQEYLQRGTGQWASEKALINEIEAVGNRVSVMGKGTIVTPGYSSGAEQLKAMEMAGQRTTVTITPGGMFDRAADINRQLGLNILNAPKGKPIDVSGFPVIAVKPARPYIEPTKYTTQPLMDITKDISKLGEEYADKLFATTPYDIAAGKAGEKGFESAALKFYSSVPEFGATLLHGSEMIARDIYGGKGGEIPGRIATGAGLMALGLGTSFKEKPIETLESLAIQATFFEAIGKIPTPKSLKLPEIKLPERTFYDPLTESPIRRSTYINELFEPKLSYIQARIDLPSRIQAAIRVSKESPKLPSYTEQGIPGMLGEIVEVKTTPKGYIGYTGLSQVFKEATKPITERFNIDIRGAFGDIGRTGKGYIFSYPTIDIAKRTGFNLDIRGAFGDMFKTKGGYIFSYPTIDIAKRTGFKPDILGAFGDIGQTEKGYIFSYPKSNLVSQISETIQKVQQFEYETRYKLKWGTKGAIKKVSEAINRPVRYFGEYGKKVKYEPYPTLEERQTTGTIKVIRGKYGEPIEVMVTPSKSSKRLTRADELKKQWDERAALLQKEEQKFMQKQSQILLVKQVKELPKTEQKAKTPFQLMLEQLEKEQKGEAKYMTEQERERFPSNKETQYYRGILNYGNWMKVQPKHIEIEKPKTPYSIVFGSGVMLAGQRLLKGGSKGLSIKTPAERLTEEFITIPTSRTPTKTKPSEINIVRPSEGSINIPKDISRDTTRDLQRDLQQERQTERQLERQIETPKERFRLFPGFQEKPPLKGKRKGRKSRYSRFLKLYSIGKPSNILASMGMKQPKRKIKAKASHRKKRR